MSIKNVNKLIEETLESIDGIEKAEPPPFFEARLKAKMESKLVDKKTGALIFLRPAFAFGILFIMLMLNVVVLSKTNFSKPGSESLVNEQPATMQSFVSEYDLGSSSGY